MANSSSGAPQIKYVLFLCLSIITGLMDAASNQMTDGVPQIKYDVFVNFRGEDIRRGFLGYLTEAFHQKQIDGFVDDKLEKGDEIWPSLVEAIQGSLISLIIFSENYASSGWCMEELVKILECREKYNQTVIPVFYHVNPTDVRHQTGSYGNALDELGKKYNLTTVQSWRHALKKAADLSGLKSFDYKCKRRQGTISLKGQLFSALLGEEVTKDTVPRLSDYIKRKIGRMKVLIVLDDVNDSNVLEKLFGNRDWFGPSSAIIITTRNKQVLVANKIDDHDIYQVGILNSSEALELFSLYAFNQIQNHF